MAGFRSQDEIVLAMLDFARLAQPDLDTKPGAVARDIFIDLPSSEIAKLYGELRNISNLQSLASAVGIDLDRQARNFSITRNQGSAATGTVIFTVASLVSDIFIPAGTQVLSRSRTSFRTVADASFSSAKANIYRSNALRIRSDLDLAGITDQYALEVRVEAVQFGTVGNVGKFAINNQSVPGISNVTNITSFSGGLGAEDDAAFRARALGVFAGSNVGTTLGYINKIKQNPNISDVLAVEPGDPLMTRDGSQIGKDANGDAIVISVGTGGKVDLYIQGADVQSFSESFIFKDLSGRSDPTDPKNDFILGQRSINPLLVFQQKRKLLIDAGTLPFQPVDSVISVSGSSSGPNFIEKFTDANGNVHGTYELVKDTGSLGGSPFGFDKIHFISNQIELTGEQETKGTNNSQDPLDFSDVKLIANVQQDINITNEGSKVDTSNRAIVTLLHTPVTTVSRVQNLTTGERYKIVTQNLDGGTTNTTGRIQISGATLPVATDILQVNYIWNFIYDSNLDYDSLEDKILFTRTVQDSVDWGFANRVEEEEQNILYSIADGYHIITELPISRVVNVNTKLIETVTNVSGKLTVSQAILNVQSVRDSNGAELYYTSQSNGSFSGFQITLPTDTILLNSEQATVYYNVDDLYSPTGTDTGSFSGSVIKLATTVSPGDTVYIDYVADVSVLLTTTVLSDLPALGSQNEFILNDAPTGNQPVQNLWNGSEIVRNLKFAPSYLKMTFQGITSTGRLSIKGLSFKRIDATMVVRKDGLLIDVSEAIQNALGITNIPSNMYLAKVAKIERVTLSSGEITSVDFQFDVQNYKLKNIGYSDNEALVDSTLANVSVELSPTSSNVEQNPTTGEVLHVVCYVASIGDFENITVSSSGVVYSVNKYAFVESIAITSGFVGLSGSLDGTVLIESATQPSSGTTYSVDYNYRAPKEGERIVVNYNYNKLITDSTFDIEDVRPVTADVLVKAAQTISVDITVNVIPVANFNKNEQTFAADIQQSIITFLTQGGLNRTVDASDIINACYAVDGTDRVDLLLFNETGKTGLVRSLVAGRNQYFVAGTILATIGTR